MTAEATLATSDASDCFDGAIGVVIREIQVEETLPLRHAVLWPDLPVSATRLPDDDIGWHFGAFSPSTLAPIAVISIFQEPLPIDKTGSKAVRFRKFACRQDFQGRGIGTALLRHVFWVAAAEMGAHAVWCDARTSSQEWYQKRGMHPFGEPFNKGPVEYVRMSISASDALDGCRRAAAARARCSAASSSSL
ncbi:hypothetical protein HDZ31DRAFT_29808 [Schizophyllum fasciatum]